MRPFLDTQEPDDTDELLAGMQPDDPETLLIEQQNHLDRLHEHAPARERPLFPPAAPGVALPPPGAGSSTTTQTGT